MKRNGIYLYPFPFYSAAAYLTLAFIGYKDRCIIGSFQQFAGVVFKISHFNISNLNNFIPRLKTGLIRWIAFIRFNDKQPIFIGTHKGSYSGIFAGIVYAIGLYILFV